MLNSVIIYAGISNCSIMEVLVVHSNEHLNLMSSDGFAPFHYAAFNGNTQVCSILAAQVMRNFKLTDSS